MSKENDILNVEKVVPSVFYASFFFILFVYFKFIDKTISQAEFAFSIQIFKKLPAAIYSLPYHVLLIVEKSFRIHNRFVIKMNAFALTYSHFMPPLCHCEIFSDGCYY